MARARRLNLDPMRAVERADVHGGNTGLSSFKSHWWVLVLECGHIVERNVRWRPVPLAPRGYAALHHPPGLDRLPDPPRRARCEWCAAPSTRQGPTQGG